MNFVGRRRPIERIPIENVPEGKDLAQKKARNNLNDAERIVDNPESVNNAGLLTINAMEELAKAIILQNKFRDAHNRGDSFIQIGGQEDPFYSHPDKINIALNAMPANLKTLTMGTFDPHQIFFQTGRMEISQDLKEYITYTGYKDGKWISPHTLDPGQVKNLIQNIKATFFPEN